MTIKTPLICNKCGRHIANEEELLINTKFPLTETCNTSYHCPNCGKQFHGITPIRKTQINITFTAISDGTIRITFSSTKLQTQLSAYEGLRTAISFIRMGIGLALMCTIAWTRNLWERHGPR